MRKQTRTLLILLAGILTLAVVVLASCENPMMSHIIRTKGFETPATGGGPWKIFTADDGSTAQMKLSYNKNADEATITINGVAEPHGPVDYFRWKKSASYSYNLTPGKIYTIKFEAMYVDSPRTITFQYAWDSVSKASLVQDYILQSYYTQHTIETITLPSDPSWSFSLFFQCADQLGTFKIKNVQFFEESPGLVYEVVGTSWPYEYIITRYDGNDPQVSIPAEKHGFAVVGIKDGAFQNNQNITEVIIPVSIKTIGANAFKETSNLDSIVFDNTGYWDNSSNSWIYTPQLTTIGASAFEDSGEIAISGLPADNLTTIGDNAFKNSNLTGDIELPGSLITIGAGAFEDVTTIDSITIPASVTYVGTGAFSGWGPPQKIIIEGDSSQWAVDWLQGCNVTDITDPTEMTDGLEISFATDSYFVSGYTGIYTQITIPGLHNDGANGLLPVTSIGGGAFDGNTDIETVKLPSSVTEIGEESFKDCTALTTINLDNVTSIGDSAFEGCSALDDITGFSNDITYLGTAAFKGSALVTVNLYNANLTLIPESAFEDCTELTGISFPYGNGPVTIGEGTFRGCTVLMSLGQLGNVSSIGVEAFKGTTNLATGPDSSIDFFNGGPALETVGDRAFEDSGLHRITLPASVQTIGANAFNNVDNLVFVSDTTTIANFAAAFNPAKLASVTIPASATSIADEAFKDMTVLATVTFTGTPELATIGESAFDGCSALLSITLPDSLTEIKDSAFDNTGITTLTIPAAFETNTTTIGTSAFATVTDLEFEAGWTTIPDYAGAYSFSLETVTIPEGVTAIADNAFDSCTSLEIVTINSTVLATIGDRAFAGTALTDLSIATETPPTLGDDVFDGVTLTGLTIHVPSGTDGDYQAAAGWDALTTANFTDDF